MVSILSPNAGGAPTSIAKTANAVGKPGRTQNLGNLHTGGARPAITGGDPLAHGLLNHYGKNPPSVLAGGSGMPGSTGVDPTQHPGVTQVRGGKGGMKKNARSGGLGPGPMSTPGGDNDYDATSQDVE